MRKIKSVLLMASVGMLGISQIQAVAVTDYSDALAVYGRHTTRSRGNRCVSNATTLKPYNLCETGHPEVAEEELWIQLDPRSRHVYRSLDTEGKAMARQLAGDHYRYNKNDAVEAAREMMQDRMHQNNNGHQKSDNGQQNGNGQHQNNNGMNQQNRR